MRYILLFLVMVSKFPHWLDPWTLCSCIVSLCFLLASRLSFLVAEICLLAGSARNAYHTKYVGNFVRKDLVSCAALRKGVFAAGATFVLVNMIASILYYWSYSKANTDGWMKHRNDGVGMEEFGPEKSRVANINA